MEYRRFSLAEELVKQKGSNYIISPISHSQLWNDEIKAKCKSDKGYDYYPRGRVSYNAVKKIFEIKMDSCLHNDDFFLFVVRKVFKLNDKPTIIPVINAEEMEIYYET
jgi:hypothetical protein